MRRFGAVFLLELKGLVRSGTFVMLLIASLGWMFAFPWVVHGDGTAVGMRELDIRYSLGGVFVLVVLSLVAAATGSLARERAAKRLALTVIRPVSGATVMLAKGAALVSVGAVVLGLSALVLLTRTNASAPCHHVFRPVLPSPREEAKEMYEAYMKNPETPTAIRMARKSTILRILENRAVDHYQVIPTNATVVWKMPLDILSGEGLLVRMRFAGQYDSRQDVVGEFAVNGGFGTVSNVTKSVLSVPLVGTRDVRESRSLSFTNRGVAPVMLRPRKDICLLAEADGFGANLLRAWVELVAVLALAVAFGLFLSATLGRPVALFVAVVTLIVGEMSPSVVEQYPDELGAGMADRIGLALTRLVVEATRPVSALDPLGRLAADECIEPRQVVRVLAIDFVSVPLFLALVAGFLIPRKQDDA